MGTPNDGYEKKMVSQKAPKAAGQQHKIAGLRRDRILCDFIKKLCIGAELYKIVDIVKSLDANGYCTVTLCLDVTAPWVADAFTRSSIF